MGYNIQEDDIRVAGVIPIPVSRGQCKSVPCTVSTLTQHSACSNDYRYLEMFPLPLRIIASKGAGAELSAASTQIRFWTLVMIGQSISAIIFAIILQCSLANFQGLNKVMC